MHHFSLQKQDENLKIPRKPYCMYIYISYNGGFLKWGRGTLKSSRDCCRATEAFSVHQQQPQDVLKATALAVGVAQAVTWDGAQPLRRYGAGCFPQ